jgi:hypothetical protein
MRKLLQIGSFVPDDQVALNRDQSVGDYLMLTLVTSEPLPFQADTFFEDQDFFADAEPVRFHEQSLEGFVVRLIA